MFLAWGIWHGGSAYLPPYICLGQFARDRRWKPPIGAIPFGTAAIDLPKRAVTEFYAKRGNTVERSTLSRWVREHIGSD
jgi:hypothetical protein